MKKAIKWASIIVGGLVVLIILALLLIPLFVDVQKYKPEIEKKVAEATGRPFRIGGDLSFSLFPWAGLSFSDLHLGNPPGFKEKDFVSVKAFEVRIKLIPILSRDIQVKRFIIESPRIVIEKNKDGRGNWEGLGKPPEEPAAKPKKKKAPEPAGEGLPIAALAVGEFAIRQGSLLWIDDMKGERKEVSDLTLILKDVSLDRPFHLALSIILDGRPLSLEGDLGPVGKEPGKGTIPFDLSIKALKELDIGLKGKIVDAVTRQQFDLALQVSPFSPRKLMESLGQAFPISTADPKALSSVALKVKVKGDPKDVSISDGALDLDQSKLIFSARVKDFEKPDVSFDLKLDKIDVDRYLPPPGEKKPGEEKKKAEAPAPEKKKTDYTPLRKLVLNGSVRIGELMAKGAKIQDFYLKVTGKNGLFNLDPLTLKLYRGDASLKGSFDVRQDLPKSRFALQARGIQVSPLLKDLMGMDILEGTVKAEVDIRMAGDDGDRIKQTLNGKGDFLFKDGAIVGIDLPGMVRNVKGTFGLGEKVRERPKTDFSELYSPFTFKNGVFDTRKTRMASPVLRVLAAGKADLVKETLDFRVEPTFVATLKGQEDAKKRTGITVPVLVTGTFSSPRYAPDLAGIFKQTLEKGITDQIGGGGKEMSKDVKEKAKGLLKGLFGK